MEYNDQSIRNLSLTEGLRVHFIGIGGSSMSGLAELVLSRGCIVSGSDRSLSPATDKLASLGAKIFCGHDEANITSDINLVVYTIAIGSTNPEYLKATELDLPCVERGIFLGYLSKKFQQSIAVAGVHGKTTTTSMLSDILFAAEKNPSVHLGGIIRSVGSNVIVGGKEIFLTEACEYHNNFLHLSPKTAIILNLEPEHLDFFGTFENMLCSFKKFAAGIPEDGYLVVCADSEKALLCIGSAICNVITYSTEKASGPDIKNAKGKLPIFHYFADNITLPSVKEDDTFVKEGYSFDVYENGQNIMSASLHVPGLHNVKNALAAIAAAKTINCENSKIASGLNSFTGAGRRFDIAGKCNGAPVINDYAHHPTEIKATIEAASARTKGRIITVFQPHTYSRIREFRSNFPDALSGSDIVIVTDIYAARETDDGSISSEMLVSDMTKVNINAACIKDFEKIADFLKATAKKDDIILLLGAGTINKLSDMIID